MRPMLTAIQNNSSIEQPVGHSSYNMEVPQIIESDTNTAVVNREDWEIVLMDINAEETMVAYITRNSYKPEVWKLSVVSLDTSEMGSNNFDATTATGPDISAYLGHQIIMHATTFLSVSKTGREVAISFLPNEESEPPTIENLKCIVMKLSKDLQSILDTEEIDFQGRAVFTDYEQLMILNLKHLDTGIYDKNFKLKHSFDIAKLLATFDGSDCPTSTFQYNLHPPNREVLVLPLETKAHVWHVHDKCVRLTTIFKEEKEQIIGISKNKYHLATYIENSRLVNVYDTEYGRKMYVLETRNSLDPDKLFEVSGAYFSSSVFLTLVGIEKTTQTNSITFEVWHLQSLRSVYFDRKAASTDSTIQTFFANTLNILREFGPYTLSVYHLTSTKRTASLQTNYIDHSKRQNIDLRMKINAPNYIQQIKTIGPHEEDSKWHLVYTDTLDDDGSMMKMNKMHEISGKILDMLFCGKCYRCVYGNRVYLLFFGMYTIQLWRLGESERDTNELLFVHAYKAFIVARNGESQVIFGQLTDRREYDCFGFLSCGSDEFLLRVVSKVQLTDHEFFNKTDVLEFDEEIHIPLSYTEDKLDKTGDQLNRVHLKLMSACDTLYYLSVARLEREKYKRQQNLNLNGTNQFYFEKYDEQQININTMMEATAKIIQDCISYILQNSPSENQYFKTVMGSSILTKLSMFEEGGKFLYQIICVKELPIALFSSTAEFTIYNLCIRENALLYLLKKGRYDLYELLFNRVLSTAKTLGISHISCLTDSILYLQYFGRVEELPETRLLKSSIERLMNLHMDVKWLPLSEIERENIINNVNLEIGGAINCENALEQLEEREVTFYDRLSLTWTFPKRLWSSRITRFFTQITRLSEHITPRSTDMINQMNSTVCIVPLLKFISYERGMNDDYELGDHINYSRFLNVALNRKAQSLFSLDIPLLESLLWYKWNNLPMKTTLEPFVTNIVLYILFAVCVAFGRNVFDYVFVEEGFHVNAGYIFLLACMFYANLWLFLREMLYLILIQTVVISFGSTIQRIFNIVTLIFPAISTVHLIKGSENFEPFCSITALLLLAYSIVSLRISFRMDSILLVTIKQMIISMMPVLVLMLVVIIAFTSSFVVLLGRKDANFFGDSSNSFGNAIQAFFNLWFCIFGVWDPLFDGDAGQYVLLRILAFIFTVIIVLVFFNFIIAEMNSSIERIRKTAKRIWLAEFAAIIAEFEIISLSIGYNRNDNPPYLYYRSTLDAVNKQEAELEESTNKLIEQLRPKYTSETTIETTIDDLQQTLNQAESIITKRMTENMVEDMDKDVISSKIKALENQIKSLNEKLNTTAE